jgi:hypothetical protein
MFYFLFITFIVPNLLPTRYIFLKFILNTLTCITNFNILKMEDRTLNTTEINSDFISYNKITTH